MQTPEVQYMPVSKDSHPQSIKSKSQSTSPQTQINTRTIRRGTLKKGTKIIIHLSAAEISGDHQTYANNPFEKITDINNNPKIYLPLAHTPHFAGGGLPECGKQDSRGSMSHPNNGKETQRQFRHGMQPKRQHHNPKIRIPEKLKLKCSSQRRQNHRHEPRDTRERKVPRRIPTFSTETH